MPHSKYAVSDRQAVGQLRYQIRRFIRQMEACSTAPQDVDRIAGLLALAISEASGVVDFDDDGNRISMEFDDGAA